jgi:hypothetical protein
LDLLGYLLSLLFIWEKEAHITFKERHTIEVREQLNPNILKSVEELHGKQHTQSRWVI